MSKFLRGRLTFQSNRGRVHSYKGHSKRYFVECEAAPCGGGGLFTIHSLPGTDLLVSLGYNDHDNK